jgi:spermidine synthase
MYQTIWVRMLTRYLGSTTSATATVLAIFMGGLALGAYQGGKIADKIKQQLYGYVLLEISIALIGILCSFAIISVCGGLYINLYEFFGNHLLFRTPVRIVFCMICLLLPTILMGATLPLLVAYITRTQYFQSGLSKLYAMNTFGAVTGVLLTGFILLGWIGERSSLYLAVLLNITAAYLVYRMAKRHMDIPDDDNQHAIDVKFVSTLPSIYPKAIRSWSRVVIFISGFSALAYEILWTRYMVLPLETSIYAFSAMLSFFLIGIAIGSSLSARFPISESSTVAFYAFFEILIGCLTISGIILFGIFGTLSKGFTEYFFQKISICFLMIFPVAVVFGWQFPIAVRCCLSDSSRLGTGTGWAYSLNTIGAILGSLIGGFVLIPLIGTFYSFLLLAALNIVAGGTLLWLCPSFERGKIPLLSGAIIVAICVLLSFYPENPYKKTMWYRAVNKLGSDAQIYAFHEEVSGTVVPAGNPVYPSYKHLFINGVGVTALCNETKLMAHLPMVLAENPNNMLVICFGMGTTIRSATRFPSDRTIEITAVEIISKVYDCFKYFHNDASQVMSLPNVHLFVDDGRNFLSVHKGLYDVITIDPSPPLYSAGTVNLLTREFMETCKSKITKTGVVCLWIAPELMTESLMIMKTFVHVFPGATLWGALQYTGFYLIGGQQSFDQTDENLISVAKQLSKIEDLKEWDSMYNDENVMRKLYLLSSTELEKLVENVPEITDDHPYTEFPLWRQLFLKDPILSADLVRVYKQQYMKTTNNLMDSH